MVPNIYVKNLKKSIIQKRPTCTPVKSEVGACNDEYHASMTKSALSNAVGQIEQVSGFKTRCGGSEAEHV